MLPFDDPTPDDGHAELLEAMTQLATAFSQEREELVRLLSSLVESQRQMAQTLDELAASVEALRAGPGEADPLAGLDGGGPEALRREARQTLRRTEALVERSRGLIVQADAGAGSDRSQ